MSCQVEQPLATVSSSSSSRLHCPLKPGVYCALPRSWCKRWRKYIKTGEGGFPPAPDASEVLCAHNLPLVPPHLESFLRGETSTLLGGSSAVQSEEAGSASPFPIAAVGASAVARRGSTTSSRATSDAETLQALRAAGLLESEVHAQRVAMSRLEDSMRHANIHDIHELNNRIESESSTSAGLVQQDRTITNEQLDRENRVVVEILTDAEVTELEKSWPRCLGGTYALRFAVVEGSNKGDNEIVWSTTPCRACDPSSLSSESFVVRNRLQKFGYR